MTDRKPRKTRSAVEQHSRELEQFLSRRGPGAEDFAPTPRRVEIARQAGQKVRAKLIHTESGFPTANYYWRITPVLDNLERRGTITNEEYNAALRYMRHYAGSRHKGPATSKLLPRYDNAFRNLGPADRAVAMGQARTRAESAVHEMFHPVLRWLEAAAEDELPLWQLGAAYYPEASQQTQGVRAVPILHFGLAMLAEHYETGHRFSRSDVEEAIETIRLTLEFERRVIHKQQKCA
jgi:hypothetical protein